FVIKQKGHGCPNIILQLSITMFWHLLQQIIFTRYVIVTSFPDIIRYLAFNLKSLNRLDNISR
ncbi:MAG: hypothetical protein KAS07_00310, partial [Candidatus Pacebacteria bacterium]|nr:hypothetical protein [Candidatus Paceibacterota bacterium]